jgi:hypothetical protein
MARIISRSCFFVLDFIEAIGLMIATLVAGAGVELEQSEVSRFSAEVESRTFCGHFLFSQPGLHEYSHCVEKV